MSTSANPPHRARTVLRALLGLAMPTMPRELAAPPPLPLRPPAGLWLAWRVTAYGTPEHYYLTLYPDGRALWTLPPEGLAGTAPTMAGDYWPQRWSRYAVDGQRVRFTMVTPPPATWVGVWRDDRMSFERSYTSSTGQLFTYWPSPAGPMNGVYRPWGAQDYSGIRFSPDGTFADEGFQRHLGTLASPNGASRDMDDRRTGRSEREARRPGKGRYTVSDYTLELRYADRRVARHTILVSPSDLARHPLPAFTVNGVELRRQ